MTISVEGRVPCQHLPCAAAGLKSYRYRLPYNFVMIGAIDHFDAMSEARRSVPDADGSGLEFWNGTEYVPVVPK